MKIGFEGDWRKRRKGVPREEADHEAQPGEQEYSAMDAKRVLHKLDQFRSQGHTRTGTHLALLLIGLRSGAVQSLLICIATALECSIRYTSDKGNGRPFIFS